MKLSESIGIVKALADSSRLQIMQSLLDKPQYVEELSERLNLAASTVSFHLKKLEKADLVQKSKEQYYVMFHANQDVLALTLQDLILVENTGKAAQEERMREYRQKVLRSFFQYGRLQRLPAQQKKRRIVLEEFARKFEQGRTYAEQEVNEIIAESYDDYCTIRRELVDWRIMAREGSSYWVLESMPAQEDVKQTSQKEKNTMNRRKELKLAYKQNPPTPGVFQVKNLKNGKILVGSRPNVEGALNSQRAQLKFGAHRNRALQQDWNEYGTEHFSFDVLECLDLTDDPLYDYRQDLAILEQLWLEKLQPYGDKGYNREKVSYRDPWCP